MDPVMSLLPPKESNLDTPNQKLNGKKTKDVTKISRKRKVHWLDDYCDDKQPSNDNLLVSYKVIKNEKKNFFRNLLLQIELILN